MKQGFGRRAVALLALGMLSLLSACTLFGQHEKEAGALELPTVGSQAHGAVSFVEMDDGVQVSYNFVGLPPNTEHALQVHERGDCNAGDGTSAGGVFAPAANRLRPGVRQAGDLGNIRADDNGVAVGFLVTSDISLDGVRSVVGRALLLHRDASDPEFPQHDAGPALACGTIRR